MEIIKILKDYSKTPLEAKINEYLSGSLDSTICREPIKNKEFMLQYIKPVNDFIIHTTAIPCCDVRRMIT
ncbi:MAG: hypothetical protein IJ877_07575 [Candidatus Gastranaerophilales bacterium]|nr:hypothetical protein [Candidatus Gastranaerophilales bacterium]